MEAQPENISQIFPDPIEDNDGVINRITDNNQQGTDHIQTHLSAG